MGTITDKAYDADQEARREQSKSKIAATLPQPYRPLSALDFNDSEKIFRFVYVDQEDSLADRIVHFDVDEDKIAMTCRNYELHIWFDGDIFPVVDGKDESIPNMFVVVDFIRSLGYSNI